MIGSYKQNSALQAKSDSSFQFLDQGFADAAYVIREVDGLGREKEFGIISVQQISDAAMETVKPVHCASLSQNFPNSFNPSTSIQYQIPVAGFVTLKVNDLTGREIASVAEGLKSAGDHTITFDGSR